MDDTAKRSTAFRGLGRIDTHHHCFPPGVPQIWSEYEHNSFTLQYTAFPHDPEEHLEFMDSLGIQTAIIVTSSLLYICKLTVTLDSVYQTSLARETQT